MADSASESDSGSIDGGSLLMPPSPISRDQMQKRIESLSQQNRVLKVELETYKLRVKGLREENKSLRQASVNIQAKAEQEEEFISNTLLKKIQALKKEKETLAINYEQEEECLTNDLSRKLSQLRNEKEHLEHTLEQEQECLVNKLMNKIQKLENETTSKQSTLEQLRREKVELENTLEQEQEALVNKLWKKMEKLEDEKRILCVKLERPAAPTAPLTINVDESGGNGVANVSAAPQASTGALTAAAVASIAAAAAAGSGLSRRSLTAATADGALTGGTTAGDLSLYIQQLRREVVGLKSQLHTAQREHAEKMVQYAREEQQIRQENQRLQRCLQQELERRENLCRNLSESESSLEMDEERQCELAAAAAGPSMLVSAASGACRSRAVSSPGPLLVSPGESRPISPATRELVLAASGGGLMVAGGASSSSSPSSLLSMRCHNCGAPQQWRTRATTTGGTSSVSAGDKFIKPAAPPVSPYGHSMQMSPARSTTPTEQAASPLSIPGSPMDTSRQ